jgi:hypothetical protein
MDNLKKINHCVDMQLQSVIFWNPKMYRWGGGERFDFKNYLKSLRELP